MTINLAGTTRYDTRGLPEGYDPHKLYEYRYRTVVKNATGFESFLYKYIPASIIQSFAIAIDPTYQFRVSAHAITPANRTKRRWNDSVLSERAFDSVGGTTIVGQIGNYNQASGCFSPFDVTSYTPAWWSPQHVVLTRQEPLPDYLKDTTARTRLYGSEQGELELFKSYINSPPRVVTYRQRSKIVPNQPIGFDSCTLSGAKAEQYRISDYGFRTVFKSPAARLPLSTFDSLMLQEIAYNKALAQKYAASMLKGWSPLNRDYELFRNIVELRDLPRSIISIQQTLIDLKKLFVSLGKHPELRASIFNLRTVITDIPNEYLSFHFGWKQTWKDLNDLLNLPEKMARRYSFLIKRNGKATSYRGRRIDVSAATASSGFVYDVLGAGYDYPNQVEHRIERETELRLVVNATFDFPPLNTPRFLSKEFAERIGIIPRPTDLYNLIPWTWLVDYFTGLGNYVELIDNINRDPSLINWGMLSVVTKGKLSTNIRYETQNYDSTTISGVVTNADFKQPGNHTSVLDYTCHTRQDVASLLSVNATSVPLNLTAYQKSIIGALLAQRVDISGHNTFRVRS